ncbi:hypothetical protein CNEONATNEC26_01236 [Clostridium neonatale]|nr:hypothetical protein CNEONATNEC26_01236 [Clostridium neonatale]
MVSEFIIIGEVKLFISLMLKEDISASSSLKVITFFIFEDKISPDIKAPSNSPFITISRRTFCFSVFNPKDTLGFCS